MRVETGIAPRRLFPILDETSIGKVPKSEQKEKPQPSPGPSVGQECPTHRVLADDRQPTTNDAGEGARATRTKAPPFGRAFMSGKTPDQTALAKS
jgi:hypothetical protein